MTDAADPIPDPIPDPQVGGLLNATPPRMPAPLLSDGKAVDLAALRTRVYATMDKRHRINPSLGWGLLMLGGAVMLAAGVVLAMVLGLLSFYFDVGFGLRTWFVLYLVAMVPVLIWQERRTRKGFFTLAAGDVDLTRDPDNVGDYLFQRSQAHAMAFVSLILWGPRAFLAGFRAIRGIRETGLDLVLPEAADILTLMLSIDGGVKIRDLVPPGDEPMRVMPVLKWLDQHDYIGISTRGDRVWVSTFAKKRLVADHGPGVLPKPKPKPVGRGQ